MIILRKDTVWGPGEKILTDDIQVASGVKLTILPGAQIIGSGHSITAYGSVIANGTPKAPIYFNDTELNLSDNRDFKGNIDISYAQLDGGGMSGLYGHYNLSNSTVTNMKSAMYAWYPQGGNIRISNNIFLDSVGVSAGTSDYSDYGAIEIDHNVFDRYYSYDGAFHPGYDGFAISIWNGGDTNTPVSHNNAFLDKGKIAIGLEYRAKGQSYSDYFGVSKYSQIHNVIYDNRDDLSISNALSYINPLLKSPMDLNQKLLSFTTIKFPSAVIKDGQLFGEANIDITGNFLNNTLVGNSGNNTINGGAGADAMSGGAGNDTYIVDNANDTIRELPSNKTTNYGFDAVITTVSYALPAGQAIEAMQIGNRSKSLSLTGNEFAQSIAGNQGINSIDGKGGADVLTGGGGADKFVFSTAPSAQNLDRITDFSAVDDMIHLSRDIFAALAPGGLDAREFKDVAKAKVDADDHILYDSRTGDLFYDGDGSGRGAAVKFAVLDNKAAITHADFLIA